LEKAKLKRTATQKMTPAQVQRYCDLVAKHRETTGCNPDVNELALIALRARKEQQSMMKGKVARKLAKIRR